VLAEAGYVIEKLDYVIKDYPIQLIENELNSIGLKPTNNFYKIMTKPDAVAFQFVGSARPGKVPKLKKREQFGPTDHFENFYKDTLINHKIEIEAKDKEILELRKSLKYNPAYIIKGISKVASVKSRK
jgi:hypothetical protein